MARSLVLLRLLFLGAAVAIAAGRCQGAAPYLNMPRDAATTPPLHLSETGAFKDVSSLLPADGALSYKINLPFWSDGADKGRWFFLPDGAKITNHEHDQWAFPAGTVFVKNFELPAGKAGTTQSLRLETRLLVQGDGGEVYGASYRWRPDGTDADLVQIGRREEVASGYGWYFPGRQDCAQCHTHAAGGVLGLNTRQLNRESGSDAANQLEQWSRQGLLTSPVTQAEAAKFDRLPQPDEAGANLERHLDAWLDVNCAMCHQPGAISGTFDARWGQHAARALLNAPAHFDLGLDHARLLSPKDPWRSVALTRITTLEPGIKMPPLAHEHVDERAAGLMRRWVLAQPGESALPPPELSPTPGRFNGATTVTLSSEDGHAEIRYTLDGSLPTTTSLLYATPVLTTRPLTLRAIATRAGYKNSIATKGTYVVLPAKSPEK